MTDGIFALLRATPDRFRGGARYIDRLLETVRERSARVVALELREDPRGCTREGRDEAVNVLQGVPSGSLLLVEGDVVASCPYAFASLGRRGVCIVAVFHRPAYQLAGVMDPEALFAAERDAYGHIARAVVSSLHGAMALAPLSVLPDQIGVVLPGADLAPPARGTREGRSFLMVGQVVERKGHFDVLAALEGLGGDDSRWSLTIIGSQHYDPDYVERLRQRVNRDPRLTMPGAVSGGELRAAMDRADLLISASHQEAGSLAIVEASAMGLPALITNAGGSERALAPGSGFVVPVGRPDRLREVLGAWLRDPSSRHAIRMRAQSARNRVRRWRLAGREFERELRLARVFSERRGR